MKLMHQLATLIVALIAVSFSSQAMALKSDREQPADIEAEDIEFDFKKGTRVYTGNVIAIQGTLRLKADKLVAEYKDGELKNAKMWGSLARFASRPDGKEHDVVGSAKQIIVDNSANILTLIGKAELTQGADTARGSTIVYDMSNDTLKVKGGAKLGTGGDPGKPNRKLEDPFKDTKPPVSDTGTKDATDSVKPNTDSSGTDEVPSKPQVEPAREGRSRLIINPK